MALKAELWEHLGVHRAWFGERGPTPIVLLHEGLGSVSAWGLFPSQLAQATGRPVLAYDRPGYGRSEPNPPPWSADFMHLEAARLAQLVDQEGLLEQGPDEPILVGHSDGATIALLYPSVTGRMPSAIVSLAAHVSVEDVCIEGISAVVDNYQSGLATQLARHHDDANAAFLGWSDIWLSERFRDWTIDAELAAVECPVLAFQGTKDTYATRDQLVRVGEGVTGPVELIDLADCDHWPHREASDEVLNQIVSFLRRIEAA